MRRVLQFIEKYRQQYESTPEQLAETCTASFGVCHGDLHKGNVLCDPVNGKLTAVIDWESVSWGPREADVNELRGEEEDVSVDVSDLAIAPTAGSWERGILCPLLLDLRFLHYFNASWWGHFIGMERKHAAIPNEAKEAEETVRQSLRTFLAEVAAGPPTEGRRGSRAPPPLT